VEAVPWWKITREDTGVNEMLRLRTQSAKVVQWRRIFNQGSTPQACGRSTSPLMRAFAAKRGHAFLIGSAAFTIATIPALNASGKASQHSTTTAKSGFFFVKSAKQDAKSFWVIAEVFDWE
jgi:hypothetical protein